MISRWSRVAVAAFGSALVAYGLLISAIGYGIDLRDEVFYLIWLHDVQAYALSYQPFPYILHPLYAALGESLILFRLLGIGLQVSIGAYLGSSTAAYYRKRARNFDGRGFTAIGALAGACNYLAWYLTPNYNMLANLGAMLVFAGWLRWFDGRRAIAIISVGLGITVSFFGKPPLAIIEAVATAVLAYWSSDRRLVFHAGALAAVTTFVIVAIAKNPIDMVADSIASQRVLSLGTGILDLPGRTYRELMSSQAVFPACATAALLAFSQSGPVQIPRKGLFFLSAFALLFFALRLFGLWKGDEHIDLVGLSFIAFGLILVAFRRAEYDREILLPVVAMLAAPFAISLGTYNPLLTQLTLSTGFAFLGVVTLARLADQWLTVELGAYVAVLLLLTFSWTNSQGESRMFSRPRATITLPQTSTVLSVDHATAKFADDLRRTGISNGIAASTPVVDLSGYSPATTIFLGGHAPVLPWLLDITPTWPDVAWSRMSPEERSSAWIIGPIHPAFDATQVAKDVSLARYTAVGKAWVPTSKRELVVYKPTDLP